MAKREKKNLNPRAKDILLILLLSCLIFSFLGTLVPNVNASSSGDFFLGSSTMSKQIWSNSVPSQIQVTVTVTNAMADTYADSEKSSVTVKTDNNEVTLYNGETQTFEDTTASVWLYENAGHDHNYYSYYGIGGTWEITTVGTGFLGIPEATENTTSFLIIGGVIVAAVIVGLFFLVRSQKKRSMKPYQAAYPPPPPPPN
jgi:hypothetical protein